MLLEKVQSEVRSNPNHLRYELQVNALRQRCKISFENYFSAISCRSNLLERTVNISLLITLWAFSCIFRTTFISFLQISIQMEQKRLSWMIYEHCTLSRIKFQILFLSNTMYLFCAAVIFLKSFLPKTAEFRSHIFRKKKQKCTQKERLQSLWKAIETRNTEKSPK